jgi:hypothetical protein
MAFRVLIVANGFVQDAPESFPPDVRKLFEQPHECASWCRRAPADLPG